MINWNWFQMEGKMLGDQVPPSLLPMDLWIRILPYNHMKGLRKRK